MKSNFLSTKGTWYNRWRMDDTKQSRPVIKRIIDWIKKHYVPLTGLLATIAIIGIASIIYIKNPNILKNLEGYGYAGVFVISVFLNATIILPVSNMTVIIAMGAMLPSPIIVGLVGGIGAGIGEMTGYLAGRTGRGLISKNNVYNRVEKWVKRWGWIAIFVLSIFPFIFDVAGIIAGAMRMPVWKFFVATWLGRTIIYVTVAYLASVGIKALPWLSG
jgi:membrane protein YqaA with SNARE-associated domain